MFVFQVVKILRPVCGAKTDLNYQNPGILPYELSVHTFTNIIVGEIFQPDEELIVVQDVELANIAKATGVVRK